MSNLVGKEEFIHIMAESYKITQKEAASVFSLYNETLKKCLLDGKEVQFKDFYKFGVKKRSAYEGSDPRNKERITIKETTVPYCKFSKTIKDELNK